MIKLFGGYYYIDFDELDKFLSLSQNPDSKEKNDITKTVVFEKIDGTLTKEVETTQEHLSHKEINGVKFELIRNFINDIGDEPDEGDEMLGFKQSNKASIRFKLAFNTLTLYNILKKLD